MANRPHPLDTGLDQLLDHELALTRHSAADGVICEAERRLIRAVRDARQALEAYRARQKFAEHFERGQDITNYTQRLANDAGIDVIDLEAERNARKVVPFPNQNTGA